MTVGAAIALTALLCRPRHGVRGPTTTTTTTTTTTIAATFAFAFICLLALGILVHSALGIPTALNVALGVSARSGRGAGTP